MAPTTPPFADGRHCYTRHIRSLDDIGNEGCTEKARFRTTGWISSTPDRDGTLSCVRSNQGEWNVAVIKGSGMLRERGQDSYAAFCDKPTNDGPQPLSFTQKGTTLFKFLIGSSWILMVSNSKSIVADTVPIYLWQWHRDTSKQPHSRRDACVTSS